jgi:hypothetical protein
MSTTATHNGTFPHSAREAVALYLERGLAPIPLPTRSKNPGLNGWQRLRLTLEDIDVHFPPHQARNVGILNGEPSGNIVDVDLDCPEAIRAAPLLLPATGWVFGRNTARGSHRMYRTEVPLERAQSEFKNVVGKMLVELRGTGGQTVVPPSIHKETGEQITWERFDAPAEVTLADLHCAVREVAAAALLAQHWPPKNSRDAAAMALTGGLVRAEWTEEHIARFVRAVAEAACDEEFRKRASKVKRTGGKIANGEKTTGWPRLAELLGQQGRAVVHQVRDWLGVSEHPERAEPFLPEPLPWPDPPAAEAFYGLPGRIVAVIEPASEADRAALLVQVLLCFGNAIGRSAYFSVEADRHHGNEFAVLVGRTSKARKGTSWGRIWRLFREAEEHWAAQRVQTGASSGEGIIWAVRDPIQKRERVKERGQPVRYEEVEVDPGESDKRLLVYEPEFANVLKQTERQGNTLSAILRQAWDGNDLRTLTKNSPARATGAHVSLVGHITSDELRRYLTETETANGFGNRHLWVCTDRSKLLPEGGSVDPTAWRQLLADLCAALDFAHTEREMARDNEAREIWRDVYGELSEGRPGLAGALAARGEAHVTRLAMLYALMDRADVIQMPHLMAALALWDYCLRSVYFIFGDQLGDPIADELLRLLRSCPDGLTRNELRDYFGRHCSSDRMGRALGLLLQYRLVRRERMKTHGRPAEKWYATKGQGQH